MGKHWTLTGFLLLFGAVLYLGAIVAEQQRAIEALVNDNAVSLDLQGKLQRELQKLRLRIEEVDSKPGS